MKYNYEKPYTASITNPVSIGDADRVTSFTIIVESGTCEVVGGGQFQGENSTPIILSAGQSFTDTASAYSFLTGYVITPVGGTVNIVIKK